MAETQNSIEKIRADFPILKRKINGKKLIYLDNAASSLKPRQVLGAEAEYYERSCANIHRGLHVLSEEASMKFHEAREKTAKFFGAKTNEVIFTKNTTESINLAAYSLVNSGILKKGSKVILSKMEHHSNLLPWQYLSKKIGFNIDFVGIDSDLQLDMDELKEKSAGADLVSISGASNTIGAVNDVKQICKIAHNAGARVLIDGAQLAPHSRVNFKEMDADFFAFSGHKMLAPTGTGALIAKGEILEKLDPFMLGGGTIKTVTLENMTLEAAPEKFEAGTPNIAGTYGLLAAINYLENFGIEKVEKHENALMKICTEEMNNISSVEMHISKKKRGGIVLFDSKIPCHELAMLLSEEGICIRSGMHCAEPIVSSFNENGLARASFYIYNTESEVLAFTKKLREILKEF